MSKHTPGPWHPGHMGEDGNCQCRTIVCEHLAGGIATVHVHNGIQSIGDGGNDCPPKEEAVANMHLIAAAPELLEALEDIIARWDTPAWKDVEPTAEVMNHARTIIAKAKGTA